MWVCPKCGREFQRNNQGHFCGQPPKTVDEYIARQEPSFQAHLGKIRQIVRQNAPAAVERIAWSMPTYEQGGKSLSFAACQKRRLLNIFKQNWLDLRIKRTSFICSMPRNCRLNCWQKLLSGVWEISGPK